jgi:hypothetical protein
MKTLLAKLFFISLFSFSLMSFAGIDGIDYYPDRDRIIEDVNKILAGKGWDPERSSVLLIRTINQYLDIQHRNIDNSQKLYDFLNLLMTKSPFKEKGTTVADMALHRYNFQFDFPNDFYCEGRSDFRCSFISKFIDKYKFKFRGLPKLVAWGSNNYPGRELYPNGLEASEVGPEILGLKLSLKNIPAKMSSTCCSNYITYERWEVKLKTMDNHTITLPLPATDDMNFPQSFQPLSRGKEPTIRFYALYDTVFMTASQGHGTAIWRSSKNIKSWSLLGVLGRDYKMTFEHKVHLKPLANPKDIYPRDEAPFKSRIFVDKNMKPYYETSGKYYWNLYEIIQ